MFKKLFCQPPLSAFMYLKYLTLGLEKHKQIIVTQEIKSINGHHEPLTKAFSLILPSSCYYSMLSDRKKNKSILPPRTMFPTPGFYFGLRLTLVLSTKEVK